VLGCQLSQELYLSLEDVAWNRAAIMFHIHRVLFLM
jgi:hypothetical protein